MLVVELWTRLLFSYEQLSWRQRSGCDCHGEARYSSLAATILPVGSLPVGSWPWIPAQGRPRRLATGLQMTGRGESDARLLDPAPLSASSTQVRAWAAAALHRHAGLWRGQWRPPAVATLPRACRHEHGGTLREQILQPA